MDERTLPTDEIKAIRVHTLIQRRLDEERFSGIDIAATESVVAANHRQRSSTTDGKEEFVLSPYAGGPCREIWPGCHAS